MGGAKLVFFAVFAILGQSSFALKRNPHKSTLNPIRPTVIHKGLTPLADRVERKMNPTNRKPADPIVSQPKSHKIEKLESTSTCEVRTGVENPLEVINFGEEAALKAVQMVHTVTFGQLRSTFLELSLGAEYEDGFITDDDIAVERLITAYMVGIKPLWEALHIIDPTLNVTLLTEQARAGLVFISETVFRSIDLIRSRDYNGSLDALAKNQEAALPTALVALVFIPMTSQTDLTAEDQDVLACYQRSVNAALANSVTVVYDTMRMVLAQVSTPNPDTIENVLSAIDKYEAQVAEYFKAEVTQKYAAIRNCYLAKFLKKTGVFYGLSALQSLQGIPAL